MWEGRTKEQKKRLAEKITDAFIDIAKSDPQHIHIIFQDIKKENWAISGQLSE
jgi:4-oxalocrotonate tautomerase